MDAKLAHLQFAQAVISRMRSLSFLLKAWSVTVAAALLALAAARAELQIVLLAYFPAIAFWALDGHCLHQEKFFRSLYDHVRGREESDVDFSMDTSPFARDVGSWSAVCFSKTLGIFHAGIVGFIVVVTIIIY